MNEHLQVVENEIKAGLDGKRVMITGGLGMIGSSLAHIICKLGGEVTVLDAFIEPFGANMFNLNGILDRVNINISDIRDRESMKILVKDVDIIFNLAGQVSHNDSIENPLLDADINYIGHLNVLENVRKVNPKAKLLFAGSRLQFGKIERNPVDENHSMRPKTPYAFNKNVSENTYRFYQEVYDINSVCFRIANPYGIRGQMKHSKYSIINFFIREAMENKPIRIFGNGEQLRDYIYVDDLAYAFLLAAVNEKANGHVFNIGSGIGTKFADMVSTVQQVVGSGQIEYVNWPESYLNVETGDYVTDISKISEMLGWRPLTGLTAGIKKTVSYYRKYKEHYF